MQLDPLKEVVERNRKGQVSGLYSVCSANEIVIRAAIRHAVTNHYPLIIESTSNQVNQFGGYTGMRPSEFAKRLLTIAEEEGLEREKLIMGGDHLGPLLWQHEEEKPAMEKAAEMVRAYTLAGFSKIHLDTSMKLADDPSGPLDLERCARRGAVLAKVVYETFTGMEDKSRRPVLVIGSEVPVPGGHKGESAEENTFAKPTGAGDFLKQVSVFRDEFKKAGVDFSDVIAFVVQPGVEFGDDFICFYDSEKAKPLTNALKTVPGIVFEGHSTDYQDSKHLAELVRDGVAFLKVGPALTFACVKAFSCLRRLRQFYPKAIVQC
jgi:D-tagatose-1,6-bisphosphate aldolase subunit GatZ/KbaZ